MQVREVDVERFATGRRADVTVVVVRSAEEFTAGHVPGAVDVPLERVIADRAALAASLAAGRVANRLPAAALRRGFAVLIFAVLILAAAVATAALFAPTALTTG